MYIRIFLVFLFIGLIVGCKSESSVENKFDDLTEKERDSVATLYHDLSMGMYHFPIPIKKEVSILKLWKY